MDNKPTYKGFSTVEMLIAMTVMSLMFSALVLVLFGSRDFITHAQSNTDALSIASNILSIERVLAAKDFNLLAASSSSYTLGSTTYNATISIELQPDYLTRKITVTVEKLSLVTYVSDYQDSANANTCAVGNNWSNPTIQNAQTNFAQLVGDSTGVYTLGGVDVYKGKLYVPAQVSGATKKNFFIFDTTKGPNPVLLGSIDITGPTISSGGTAVVVATSSIGNYAYVANAYNTAQLQIVDITNPGNPILVASYQIPTTTASAHVTGVGTSGASGSSIYYKDGYVYVGLTTTATGPEFNIIDVHNPHMPVWVGGYKIGYVVNAIYVANNVAYLAHPTDSSAITQEQVTVLSLADKTNPVRISGYKAPDKQGNGKSIYTAGDNLYLGRTVNTTSSNYDSYVLDTSDPSNLAALNPNTPQPLGVKISSSINALFARGSILFLLSGTSGTPGALKIFNMSNSTSTPVASVALPGSSSGAGMDCEGTVIYATSNDSSNKGYLSIIYP